MQRPIKKTEVIDEKLEIDCQISLPDLRRKVHFRLDGCDIHLGRQLEHERKIVILKIEINAGNELYFRRIVTVCDGGFSDIKIKTTKLCKTIKYAHIIVFPQSDVHDRASSLV
ncbi:hypothetical protein A2841_00055 [Candidatus Kaiserbacteria bacterium RIFCSPHIGHO2_01_FULL_48_10]|uniref:Uncharacterized protein n=1 Tax=Candidatus Kaiserbacteria bacterium RIFCSPHIGHO2_01_FULL_48_10 TaxID=1798476 RepID=A0A1F6C5M7_9BACT|nr:MAG: hypothetical protein A2841_00055 [Candidatus Kaiserbacteria bacterium RIFCSPHIGHO2_01_FULL_48_10]